MLSKRRLSRPVWLLLKDSHGWREETGVITELVAWWSRCGKRTGKGDVRWVRWRNPPDVWLIDSSLAGGPDGAFLLHLRQPDNIWPGDAHVQPPWVCLPLRPGADPLRLTQRSLRTRRPGVLRQIGNTVHTLRLLSFPLRYHYYYHYYWCVFEYMRLRWFCGDQFSLFFRPFLYFLHLYHPCSWRFRFR